jgi:hypothetical protein
MRDVRLGDRIMLARADGSLGYEDVYLNTHKDSVSATPYVELALASGQSLTLSPRHFIPIAPEGGAEWQSRVLKGANEVKVGDVVWHQGSDGAMLATTVTAVTETVETGAFNPLTLSGTIVVDGVVASAHSNWFLDGVVSAHLQGQIYQAMFAPVRGIYHLIGPEWTRTIAEDWGVVDFARESTSPQPSGSGLPWALVGALLLAGVSLVVFRRVKRPVLR